jgi:phosphoglycolate phosphatase
MQRKIKNILFDLDGTIIDPKIGITESIMYALNELGVEMIPEPDDLVWCIGPPLQDSFSVLLKTDDKIKIDEAIRLYRVNYNKNGILKLKLYDDIINTIRILKKEGVNLYIATSKPRVMAVKILEHLSISDLFDGIYGAELDGIRSRKGDLISFLLEKENISTNEVIMIGDRKYDIMGAKENSIISCGVCYGYGTEEELLNAGADFIVQTPMEIGNVKFMISNL